MTERDICAAASGHTDPTIRAAFLDEACGGDTALRDRVEQILQADPDSTVGPPAAHTPAADEGATRTIVPIPDEGAGATRTLPPNAGEPEYAETKSPDDDESDVDLGALLSPPQEEGSLGRLDHYEVLGVVGRGGMGIVLRAHDTRLRRVVALKLLAPALAAVGTARRRFAREAQSAAAVRDEHVVDIHEVCEDRPIPFLVMEFVDGITLEDRVRAEGPLPVREVVRVGVQSARGLAAAHARGLVHRDVKPGNILLEGGTGRVKITDFGLARAADDASISRSGVIAGTPMYMSPEQAKGDHVDPRSDLFSLGSVLYTLLTGRPAFRADSTVAVLRRVCKDNPRPIREVNPDVPRWLCVVVEKLLAKDPVERIQTAAEVADLLGRYLAHLEDPDRVAPPPPVRGVRAGGRRWRKPVLAAVALVAAVGLAVGGYRALRPADETAATQTPPVETPGEKLVAGWKPPTPEELAARPSPLDGRTREHLPAGSPQQFVAVLGHAGEVWAAAVSPDGRTIASGGADGTVRLWDLAGWTAGDPQPPSRTLTGHTAAVYSVAFTPDGKLVASASHDGTVRLWDAVTGEPARTLEGEKDKVAGDVAFSADGKLLATGTKDGSVRLWDVASGDPQSPLRWHTQQVNSVAFSPDNRFLASAGLNDRKVHITDLKTFRRVQTLGPSGDGVAGMKVAFGGDGRTLAYGGWDETVRLWDLVEKKETVLTGTGPNLNGLAVDPSGRFVAATRGGAVRFWDRNTPTRPVVIGPGPFGGTARHVAFTPEGRYLVVAGANGTVSILRTPDPRTPSSPDAVRLNSAEAVNRLRAALEAGPASLADLAASDFADVPLTKADAAAARELLWQAHAALIRKDRADEVKNRLIKEDKLEMPFTSEKFGQKPKDGWSLYISLHGGGGVPKATNDQQWENQKKLYTLEEGIYLTPRAPTNTWCLWHEGHIDRMLARLIEDLVVLEDVNPNRVYVLGYGAGGDGVYQIAPRLADHWAGAAMMGGHPNKVSPLSLRNVPFALQVGADDTAYDRNKLASEYGETLAQLRKDDPKGYEQFVKIHEGKGNIIHPDDQVALPWVAKFTRNPVPDRVVWKQTGAIPAEGAAHAVISPQHDRSYWLAVPPGHAKLDSLVAAKREGQTVEITAAEQVGRLLIRFDDRMLDLDRPVTVTRAGKELFAGELPRTVGVMVRTLAGRGDPGLVFDAEVEVELSGSTSKDAAAHVTQGIALLNKNQVDEAIVLFRKAVELDPKLAAAHHQLGVALNRKNQVDEAIACWRRAVELDPKLTTAHFSLGSAMLNKNQLDEAIVSYNKVLELDPRNSAAHNNLGNALSRKGQVDEAIASYRKAVEFNPKNAIAHRNLGVRLLQKGLWDEAATIYGKALELEPKSAVAQNGLARAKRLAAAEKNLPAFLKGDFKPTTNAERIDLSELCLSKKLYRAGAALSADIFAADPKLADNLASVRRYNAACFAALAAAGQGEDATNLGDAEKTRLRKLALAWLRDDLVLHVKQLESGLPTARAATRQMLTHWQQDADLAGVRDAASLEKLPAGERAEFTKLWADVAALLKKAEEVGLLTEAEIKRIAALPAAEQVEEVRKELRRRNPQFDGQLTHKIENGAVTELAFTTDQVGDLAPVRALTELRKLTINGTVAGNGKVADLSPLKGLSLVELTAGSNKISDLTPLKGMPLKRLYVWQWTGSDLTPLRGMPLEWLNVGGGNQKLDLAPLADLPLDFLCINWTQVTDLSPLKKMPLTTLLCANTPVSDLTPLRDTKIKMLAIDKTKVTDLSPLRGLPLADLGCEDSGITDLSPLKDLPLKKLRLSFQPGRDTAILREIKTLETINDTAAAEFWKSAEKK